MWIRAPTYFQTLFSHYLFGKEQKLVQEFVSLYPFPLLLFHIFKTINQPVYFGSLNILPHQWSSLLTVHSKKKKKGNESLRFKKRWQDKKKWVKRMFQFKNSIELSRFTAMLLMLQLLLLFNVSIVAFFWCQDTNKINHKPDSKNFH